MIDALRNGNIVSLKGHPWNVIGIDGVEYTVTLDEGAYANKTSVGNIEPIEITPEWLEKFGFEKVNSLSTQTIEYQIKYNRFYIRIKKDIFTLMVETDDYDTELVDIKHIHQLQNLFHALTGEELTIKK